LRISEQLARATYMFTAGGYYNRTDTGALQMKVLRDVELIKMMSRQIIDTGEFAVVSVIVALLITAIRMPMFVPVFILYVPLIWLIRRSMVGTELISTRCICTPTAVILRSSANRPFS
jgi:hypothetical protein